MAERNYYAARKGILKLTPMNLSMLKEVFLRVFNEFEDEKYFQEAAGYYATEKINGLWGKDIELYIYLKLKMEKIWPIPSFIEIYDESTLFTVIEFLYDYVSIPDNSFGFSSYKYDKIGGREKYRNIINGILKDYERRYQLSSEGEIVEVAPTGFEMIFEETPQTDDHNNIDNRIKNAISKFRKYGATIDDKKDAIRSLADVLEFLRKEGIKLPSKDDDALFEIINKFDIRHHNRSQQAEYNQEIWYPWMFYTFLSSINVLLKLRMEKT